MTFIFDIDGTLVEYLTNNWLDGVLDKLKELSNNGHRIILVTRRRSTEDDLVWNKESTEENLLPDLDERGIDYDILWNVQSPRYIIDDSKCHGIQQAKNTSPVPVIDTILDPEALKDSNFYDKLDSMIDDLDERAQR